MKDDKIKHVNKQVGIIPNINNPKKKIYNATLINKDEEFENEQRFDDPHENPKLDWYNKSETDKFEIDILPLHIHEKISPSIIIKPMLNTPQTLLEFFNEKSSCKETMEFYQHKDNWSNRLILGDSLLTMTSLIENEPSVSGHVQMIYFDPPYGINYSSNFQSGFKVTQNKQIEYRPEAIKAFRDTWDYGVHSYLSTIRKQLVAAHELLADTGSIFLQISQINVHRVRLILDEVFGAENFIWDILYQTKSGAGVTHPSTCDYILWYAKDKTLLKKSENLHTLYLDRTSEHLKQYNKIHLPNGDLISIPKDGKIPNGGKLCRSITLFSQHISTTDRSQPHKFPNGKIISVSSNVHWAIGHKELDELYYKNRLSFTENNVRLLGYVSDHPAKMDNVWKGMNIVNEKIYDVQTKTTVVERCMLMSTNPGDLVMDLTCGSGVTPYCAEKHGRRWIACDVSKLALSIATSRLQTSVFDWYKLKNESQGIYGGLRYEEFIKLTAGTLSAPDTQKTDYRYDKPIVEKKRFRVPGPFTIEAIPSPVILSTTQQIDNTTKKIWSDSLRTSGVITNNGRLKFKTLIENTDKTSPTIHYIGTTKDCKIFAISFGPKHSPLTEQQVTMAIKERKSFGKDGLLFIGSIISIDAKDVINTAPIIDNIFYAEANSDLLIPDLKNKEMDRSFVQIGRPSVDITLTKNDKYIVQIKGYDYFDVEKSKITHEGTDKIAMWLLDTDYDGITMSPQQIFFPNTDHIQKLAKKLKATLRDGEINTEKLSRFSSNMSLPFKLGKQKTISVKIIDMDGRESKYTKNME